MRFQDRQDAGRQLAAELAGYSGREDVIVLALPRGGVPVGFEVARALDVPLDVFLVRKIGVPGQRELAMGALAAGGVRVINRTGVSERFNYILEFVLDENTPGPLRARNINMPPPPGADNEVPPAATIFSALEDQLGLKLERASAGREFIVVDRIERPSAN